MMKKFISNPYLCTLIAALFLSSMLLSYSASYPIADRVVQSQQQKILVCTTAGIQWLSVSDLLGDKPPLPSHSQHPCALCSCSAYYFTDLLLSHALISNDQPALLSAFYWRDKPVLIPPLLFVSLQARAPPYFV